MLLQLQWQYKSTKHLPRASYTQHQHAVAIILVSTAINGNVCIIIRSNSKNNLQNQFQHSLSATLMAQSGTAAIIGCPCYLSGDERSAAAVAEVRSMSNSMCKMTKRQKMCLMAAAEESSDQKSNASSLAIRSASILAIKDLSPKLEVSKIFRELLQVLTVIFGNVSLSIVSDGMWEYTFQHFSF